MARVTRTCSPSGCDDTLTPIDDRELANQRGHTHELVVPPTPGLYRVQIAADDALPATLDVWATGEGTTGYAGDGIVADRTTYRPGDTARLAFGADLAAPTILLTIEHAGAVDARVIPLGSTAEGVEVAIARACARSPCALPAEPRPSLPARAARPRATANPRSTASSSDSSAAPPALSSARRARTAASSAVTAATSARISTALRRAAVARSAARPRAPDYSRSCAGDAASTASVSSSASVVRSASASAPDASCA